VAILKPVNDPSLLAPTHTGRSTSCMEKLSKMFGPTDFVKVINPDTEAYIWQWLPPQKEEISFDSSQSTVPVRIMYRGEPEVWKIEPGQSGTLVGANAYVMIDGLVKRLMAKKTISRNPNIAPGQSRNFNFSDDVAQQEWINEIYLGTDNPFDRPESVHVTNTPTNDDLNRQIDDDLGIADAPRVIQEQAPRAV
jgi:hypothetical protein